MTNRISKIFAPIFLSLVLSGCQGLISGPVRSGSADLPIFVPPTLSVTITPSLLPSPTPGEVTATPECVNDLDFKDDITIEDGTKVSSGESLDKKWLVENSGTCDWDESYGLKFIEGSELGVDTEQSITPALNGEEVTLEIQFTAPSESGTYKSAWRAVNSEGDLFGDTIYIQIVVK